jgi:alcohol dehydrogenase (NADP+)
VIDPGDFRNLRRPLRDGAGQIPVLGFGTLIADPIETRNATAEALEAGFRQLDCAERYRNEREVGEALTAALTGDQISRQDLFATTKLWNTHHRPERVEPAFSASLERLALTYLDLYLIHTPYAFQPGDEQDPRGTDGQVLYDPGVTLLDTWRAMEQLVDRGQCRAIGVSDIGLAALASLRGREAWAAQRGTALLTTPMTPARARENFDIRALADDAFEEINGIQIRQRFNDVVRTGSPGFIPNGR